MMLPGYGGGFMLPTRDNRFVIVLSPYPSQQVKTFQIFRCGLIEAQMAQVARKWDAVDPHREDRRERARTVAGELPATFGCAHPRHGPCRGGSDHPSALAAAGAECLNLNMPGYVEERMLSMQSDVTVTLAQATTFEMSLGLNSLGSSRPEWLPKNA